MDKIKEQIARVEGLIEQCEALPNNAGAVPAGKMKFTIKHARLAIKNVCTASMYFACADLEDYQL